MIANLAAGVRTFTSNAFLVSGERTALVDAGANFDVVSRIEERTDDVDALVLTHTHPDHVGNLDDVVDAFGVSVYGYDPDVVDERIEDGDTLRIGDHVYEALYTPGHAPDHLCFYSSDAGVLFAGDLLFGNGGFGRTDLAGGDHDQLVESIDRVTEYVGEGLAELHAGHGPSIVDEPHRHVTLARRMAAMA